MTNPKVNAVIMAGGKGERLLPLTKQTPKPLLQVGNKAIIEYNIELLSALGIKQIHISINYLGEKIMEHLKAYPKKDLDFKYIKESKALGTIGALQLKNSFQHDYIVVMNADLLTNVDLNTIIKEFSQSNDDALIVTIPYEVKVPHGVVETKGKYVATLKEKPSYTHYSNAGIYIFKKDCLNYIPENQFFNATDLINTLLDKGKKIINYPVSSFWLDIGTPQDYQKAQEAIIELNL